MRLPLHRSLKAYHSQLIALGSAIGTGLFIGSGQGLATAGPIPLLLAFAFVGFTLCPTVFALGEMATFMPYAGGFVEHSRRFVDDAWGAAIGWNYAFQWLVTLPLELVAATITLQYWGQPLGHRSVWITIFLLSLATINIFGVRGWANVEAGLSIIKVVAIVGFLILGVLLDIGLGFNGNSKGVELWYVPGAVYNGWWGFCSVLVTAAFAYSGSEMVGLTAAEQTNPRRDMPKAIRKVFLRIGIFYIASIVIIGLLVPYTEPLLLTKESHPGKSTSPFVIAIQSAKVHGLPSIFNAVILITVLSVANSSIYGSSRVLNAMANVGLAPMAFAYVDRKGRPLRCFYLAALFGLLAYLVELKEQATVFFWLLALCGLSSIISWTSICITHLRFRKALAAKNVPLEALPFRSPLGKIGTWVGLICNIFIIIVQFLTALFPVGWDGLPAHNGVAEKGHLAGHLRAKNFFSSFMAFPLLVIFYLCLKFFKGTHVVGVTWQSWFRVHIHEPRIVWGEGTRMVDLDAIDFANGWWLEDYIEDAGVELEELWWCPKPLREPLVKMYFPW
ncbi:amino acid permease/ SLC12A domain-containing protein [Leptodontidium sp. 2 PMI_412]|nr:amino acid permease/ SLC12A domain-containing protein [Leptodontidium sp. 2 PMI_412]